METITDVIVQSYPVVKEPISTKGPRISWVSQYRFIVLCPFSDRKFLFLKRGYSKRKKMNSEKTCTIHQKIQKVF
jgi:hypothetical protein